MGRIEPEKREVVGFMDSRRGEPTNNLIRGEQEFAQTATGRTRIGVAIFFGGAQGRRVRCAIEQDTKG